MLQRQMQIHRSSWWISLLRSQRTRRRSEWSRRIFRQALPTLRLCCLEGMMAKSPERNDKPRKRKGKEKAPEETLETLKSLRAGCCRGWRPKTWELEASKFGAWGFKFWRLRLQNWRLEASNMEDWGLSSQNLRLEASKFEGWGLRLQNLRLEASKFSGLRLEASKFDGWGLGLQNFQDWGFKFWRLRLQNLTVRGLRRYIIGGYLGTSSRQPGKRQRKREKENQKSEDQFSWHTLNCSKIELFVKSKTLSDDMIKDWWYDPRLWLKYQKATGAWNL